MVIKAVLGEEVRVPSGDDGVARQPAGVTVVGMEPVPLPRVVPEHDVRAEAANDPCHVAHRLPIGSQLTVDAAEEHDLANAVTTRGSAGQSARRLALLDLAAADQRVEVGADVPCAFRPVGTDEVVQGAAAGGPLGQGAAGAELDVVGVGADSQRGGRRGQVARPALDG